MRYALRDTANHDAFPAGTFSPIQARRLAARLERMLGNAPMPLTLRQSLRTRILDVSALVALIKVYHDPQGAAAAVERIKMLFLAHAYTTSLRANTSGALRHTAAKKAAAALSLAEAIDDVPHDAIDRLHLGDWLQQKTGSPKQRTERLRGARSFAVFCEQEFKVCELARACDDAWACQSEWFGGRFTVVRG